MSYRFLWQHFIPHAVEDPGKEKGLITVNNLNNKHPTIQLMNIYFAENNPNTFVLIPEKNSFFFKLKMRTLSLRENKNQVHSHTAGERGASRAFQHNPTAV